MNKYYVKTKSAQIKKVVDVLNYYGDKNYLLLLSGGNSPLELYSHLSRDFTYPFPNDIAMVDERWGDKLHENSNESVIKDSGLLGRAHWESSFFHPVLSEESKNFEDTARRYNEEMVTLLGKHAGRVVAIMGMGIDGHTAGVLPGSEGVASKVNVIGYESEDQYKKRITVTLNCIRHHFVHTLLLLDTKEKCDLFEKVTHSESDVNEFPVLVYKSMPNVDVICLPH